MISALYAHHGPYKTMGEKTRIQRARAVRLWDRWGKPGMAQMVLQLFHLAFVDHLCATVVLRKLWIRHADTLFCFSIGETDILQRWPLSWGARFCNCG